MARVARRLLVSEYQYYEFLAVDRALDEHQLGELRALSTRARLAPTGLVTRGTASGRRRPRAPTASMWSST